MKLKTTGLLMLVSVIGSGTGANAAALFDIYAGGTAGIGRETVFTKDDHESMTAQSYGALVGVDIPFVRVEAEYNYLHAENNQMHMGMLNAYVKAPFIMVVPYLGVGIGTIFNGEMADTIDIRGADAYQAMAGVTLEIPVLPIKADIEGRFLYAPDIYETATAKPDFVHYDLRAKLRYIF